MDNELRTITKSTELTNLHIDENSGVGDPANGVPGWLLMKAAGGFHPDNPAAVVEGTAPFPHQTVRTTDAQALEAYYEATARVRQAFENAEGRSPTADDENYVAALTELWERYFPEDDHLTDKPEGVVAKALRGERAVIRSAEDQGGGRGLLQKATRAGGLIGAALRERVSIGVSSSYEND